MAIKYKYNYTEYNNSKTATDISHILNMFLAFFYPVIGIGNLVAIAMLGLSVAETFDLGIDSLWFGLIAFFVVVVADILFITLKTGIDIICERIAISEIYKDAPEEIREEALKNNSATDWSSLWYIIKTILLYAPLVAVAISSIVAIFCSVGNNEIPILVTSVIILIMDIVVWLLIKNRM